MAKSLDELIDFLLEEVALVGEGGLTFDDIVQATARFYSTESQANRQTVTLPADTIDDPAEPNVNLDRAFLEKVWTWICRHPDTSISRSNGRDSTPTRSSESNGPVPAAVLTPYTNDQTASLHDPGYASGYGHVQREHSSAEVEAPVPSSRPRVHVTLDRVYLAICGHLPDISRVLPMEWKLLSHIAAARHEGIFQGDLVRASGQDKRSVPKRTDALCNKGYIWKLEERLRGNKTSRLMLRRYPPLSVEDKIAFETSSHGTGDITVKAKAKQMFDVFRQQSSMSEDELLQILDMRDGVRRQIFVQMIRHYSHVGCIRYLRTASDSSGKALSKGISVQRVRFPDTKDHDKLDKDDIDFDQSYDKLVKSIDPAAPPKVTFAPEDPSLSAQTDTKHSAANRRTVPQWNPDRILSNIFIEVCQAAGREGLGNLMIRKQVTGTLTRRIIESHLVKISNASLQIQPPGLLHLALLRSRQTIDGVVQYVHHAFDAYANMVENREARWMDVSGGEKFLKQLEQGTHKGSLSAPSNVQRDEFGFSLLGERTGQVKGGEISVSDIITGHGFENHALAHNEPVVAQYRKGEVAESSTQSKRRSLNQSLSIAAKIQLDPIKRMQSKFSQDKPVQQKLGRPRKFVEGTEKWWRAMFIAIKAANNPTWDRKSIRGLTDDPGAMRVFNARPSEFDRVLVQALKAGLPTPVGPDGISDEWIESTLRVLDRVDPGLYTCPTGQQHTRRVRASKIIIFRSSRLASLNLPDLTPIPKWCFFSSSIAHSLPIYGFTTTKRLTLPPMSSYPLWLFEIYTPEIEDEPPQSEEPRAEQIPDIVDEPPQIADSAVGESQRRPSDAVDTRGVSDLHSRSATVNDEADEMIETVSAGEENFSRSERQPLAKVSQIQQIERGQDQSNESCRAKQTRTINRTSRARNTKRQSMQDSGTPEAEVSSIPQSETPFEAQIESPSHTSHVDGHEKQVEQMDVTTDTSPSEDIRAGSRSQGVFIQRPRASEPTPQSVSSALPVAEVETEPRAESVAQGEQEEESVNAAPSRPSSPGHRHPVANNAAEDEPFVENIAAEEELEDGEDALAPAKTRKVPAERGRTQITRVTRNILIDLVDLCSGLAPFDQSTFRRALAPRWVESGMTTKIPTARIVRVGLKALSTTSRFKLITFAFRSKKGIMLTKSIIARRHFGTSSPEVLTLQQKMKEAGEADYIPPELRAEEDRAPSTSNKRGLERDSTEEEREENVQPWKRRKVLRRGVRCSPPPKVENINVSFVTLKVLRLYTLNLPPAYDVRNCKGPTAPPAGTVSGMLGNALLQHRSRPQTRNLIWSNTPRSIEQVPGIGAIRKRPDLQKHSNTSLAIFVAEVDRVAEWEKVDKAFDRAVEGPVFINHMSNNSQTYADPPPTYRFENLTLLDENNRLQDMNMSQEVSWPPFAAVLQETVPEEIPEYPQEGPAKRATRKRRRRKDDDDDDQYEEERPKKRKRKRRAETDRISRVKEPSTEQNFRNKARRNQNIRHVPVEVRYRLILCVIIVRTLTGGIEKYIDWELVSRFFPHQDMKYIQLVWRGLWHKYRPDVRNITESFQECYLEALAIGDVPSVNFKNLAETDWEGILQWGLESLDKFAGSKADDLPATRKKFERRNYYTFNEPVNLRDMLSYGANITAPRKEELVSSIVFGIELTVKEPQYTLPNDALPAEEDEADPVLARAKSWVIALILTPIEQYDPIATHAKLLQIVPDSPAECEKIMHHAIRSLQREKVISKVANGASGKPRLDEEDLTNVRLWIPSSKFTETFETRRQVNMTMLRSAAKYKLEVLDPAFATNSPVSFANGTLLDDGAMVAVLNLQSQGHIHVKCGPDKPDTRYGLDWENHGYTTKLIDKTHLGFSVHLFPAPTYQQGDPFTSPRLAHPIPTHDPLESSTPSDQTKIPMWQTIDRVVLPDRWSAYLAAVVGLISIRPGIDALELSRSLGSMMTVWEVNLVVGWLENIGAVVKTQSGRGWETSSDGWWWMCVGVQKKSDVVGYVETG